MGFRFLRNACLVGLLPPIVALGAGCSNSAAPANIKPPTFGTAILIIADGGLSGSSNVSLIAGDLNGDGLPDLVESSASNYDTVFSSVLLGSVDGGLNAPQAFGQSAAAAVLDPDAGAAFASIDGSSLLGIHAGDGSPLVTYPISTFAYGFSVADLNLDGRPDIVLCAAQGKGIDEVLNLGGGKFKDPAVLTLVGCNAVAAGDLNQDGVPDLVALGYTSFDVQVLLGKPEGGFSGSNSYPTHSSGYGFAVVLKDLNGDGLPDIIAVDSYGAEGLPDFHVLLNQGQGQFHGPVSYPIGSANGLPLWRQVVIADFNGDGWPDVVVSRYGSSMGSDLYLFLNRGDGTFLPSVAIDTGLPCPRGIAAYPYGDAGAQLPSLAIASACGGQLEILPNITKP
jgi:hypothetical protein